jgi:predicted nucleotide-binding protein
LKEEQGKFKARARQNVILELGYFIGRLASTCAIFSDVEGMH